MKRRVPGQPGSLKGALNRLIDQIEDGILGTVKARQHPVPGGWNLPLRDPKSFWCDVQPEREAESLLEHVPMAFRAMNYSDDLGFILVPKMNTEVLVEWIDGRPTITACQEWDILILKKGETNFLVWDIDNNVEMKITGSLDFYSAKNVTQEAMLTFQTIGAQIIHGPLGAYSHVLGEMLVMWLSTHTHTLVPVLTPAGYVTSPPVQIPALPGILSKRCKLDV